MVSALPNVGPHIYNFNISGFTRSSMYIYIYIHTHTHIYIHDISRQRVSH